MGLSSDYPNVETWVKNPSGYQTGSVTKYEGNIFRAAFWADEPGVGDPNKNGWRFFDELYDKTQHKETEKANVIAYIPSWRKEGEFDYAKGEMYRYLTHGIVAFLTFSEKNSGAFDEGSLREVGSVLPDVLMAANLYGTKVMVALGGASDYAFLDLMTEIGNNPESPKLDKTVRAVVDFVTQNGLDGVDLDLECWWGRPGGQDQGGRMKSDGPHPAGKGLTLFAKKLRQAMPEKTISAAVFGTSWYGNNYDPGLAEHVDWLGVMTYDLTGSWDRSPVGPHSALHTIRGKDTENIRKADVYLESYLDEQQGGWPTPRAGTKPGAPDDKAPDGKALEDNPILSVEDCLWYWTNPLFMNWQGKGQGIDRKKIAAGVPVYGYDFSAAKTRDDKTGDIPPGYKVLPYKEILDAFPDAHEAKDGNIKVRGETPRPQLGEPLPPGTYPYAHNVYFETPETAVAKLKFLKDVGAQGVIIWELSNDVWEEGKGIIEALYHASGNQVLEPSPGHEKPTPVAGTYLWDSLGFLGHAASALQFQDDGTQDNGMRQFSARLWDIPDGVDWKSAAQNAPAVIKRQYFNRPTRIVDKGALGLWGEFDVLDDGDVPDWFWSHVEKQDEAPDGYTRYSSRLMGLSLDDDWKECAKKTPALIAGQYFDEPTEIDDQGIGGLWGIFDVSDKPSPVPAPTTQSQGENDCMYCQVGTVAVPEGWDNVRRFNLTNTMTIGENAPFLYAVVTKDDDSVDFPDGVFMSLKDPDGNAYDKEVDEDGRLVKMSGDSVRLVVVKDPQAGDWTMTMRVAADAAFRCECNTVPSRDVFNTMLQTARRRDEGAGGIAPRSIGGDILAAFLGVAIAVVLIPEAAITAALTVAVTAAGIVGMGYNAVRKKDSAEKMGTVASIVSKIGDEVRRDGFEGVLKCVWLIGKNISEEEVNVIRRKENWDKINAWIGVHIQVYKVVEHMTDPEMQNSVRHVFWQCLLTKRLGKEFATEMGDAHERGRPGSDADNKADERNNEIGQQLAEELASEDECLKRTRELWEAGKLAIRPDYEGDPT
ncbi:glycosyl hydrolase family 18 protein [Streptomyces sp. NPDC046821]|uniref:glycoside hydrolase family 18 protein n=1 Tax=Streptomyces sp. NPDC046821 TaxID=3154702 RepID=UPI0033F02D0B